MSMYIELMTNNDAYVYKKNILKKNVYSGFILILYN